MAVFAAIRPLTAAIFEATKWRVQAFGHYAEPISMFANYCGKELLQLQQTLAVSWAIEIYRNLSQSGSLLYRLMAEAPKVPATDSANVDTILAPIWV